MKKCLRFFTFLLLSFCAIVSGNKAYASHIYGMDIYYTYQSGNTYTINMVIYGDCSAGIINTLVSNTPEIEVYNGSSLSQTINLSPAVPNGTEITPVCAADINSTACTDPTSSIPGVKKYTYSGSVTLSGASANWRFHFTGRLSATNSAGRSSSITNVVNVGNTIICLDATLNNLSGNNSSPVYTTIPTPFFCVNKPANYNSGAVDANGDSLSFALVAGQDATNSTAPVPVTYVSPYTPANPLDVTAGTFSFSSTTGQLSFTPDIQQRSLVVYTVTEYRNGVVVGTSQREMSFVVLASCSNNPPTGSNSNPSTSTVTVVDSTDIQACQSSGLFTFQINPTDPDGNNITVTYAGLPAGATFTVTNNGTASPHGTFSWNPASAAPGVYTYYITYQDDGCPLSSKQTLAYTVTILAGPNESFSLISPATCTKKAVFKVTPIGVATPYHIDVLQGTSTIQSFTTLTTALTDSLAPGTYTFRTYNTNNCYKDTTVTLAPPPAIIPNVTYTIPFCPHASTGSINITAGGGLPPFTYAIGSGAYSSNNNFSSLAAGTYTLHIMDGNNCVKDTTVALPDATPILLSVSLTKPPCNHFQNGVINVVASNSVGPYQYAMGPTGTYTGSGTFFNLFSGTYDIFIKNANGCVIDTNIVLPDSLKIHATLNLTNILCNSSATGGIVVNASGAFGPPYTYAVNTNPYQNSNVFGNLTAATYAVHVRDPDQCYFDTTVTITQPTPIVINPTLTNVSCHGTATGSIVATTTGGVTPYQYSLNSGSYQTSSTFSNLTAGTYIINVKDANNCVKHDTVTITEPATLVISNIVTNNVACNGAATGSFVVTASGGTTPYTYAVNTGSFGSSNTLGGLTAGTYTIHLKDNHGCTVDSPSNVITQPTAIVPSVALANSTCHTLANGSVTISATGGTPGYTYAYNSNAYSSNATFSPLPAGSYTFHIKDNASCIKDTVVNVIDSLVITGIFNITPATCYGISDAAMAVTGAGGTNPYVFAMNSGAYTSTSTFSGIAGGVTYAMHIKDNNGCIKDTNVLVPQPTLLLPHATFTQPSCHGYNDGTISITATGATPPYTFALGTGTYSTTVLYPNIATGQDTVHVKDANGCQRDTVFTVTQPTQLKITNLSISNVKCYGDSSGFVTVTASGATPPYNYGADAFAYQASNVVGQLNVGSHTIHVKDNNGCLVDSAVSLMQPTKLAFVMDSLLNPTCEGYTDGRVVLNATGGVSPYNYSLDNVSYSPSDTFSQLAEGNYNIYTKDNNNCVYDTSVTLTGYPHIVINNITVKDLGCNTAKDGSITLDVSGGNPPLLYFINTGFVAQTSNVFDSLKAGQYTITITDSTKCNKDTTATIHQPDSLAVSITVAPNDCEGLDNSGAVSVNVTGGTPPYTYLWSTNPVNTSSSVSGLPNGSYEVFIHDAGQCADTVIARVQYDDCCKPYVPDAFTPNNDGKNDLFRVRFKGDMKLQNLSIYNRFGQRVFTTIYIDQGWDGNYNGVPQPMDTYFYYIKVWCGNKEDHTIEMHGDLTLIR